MAVNYSTVEQALLAVLRADPAIQAEQDAGRAIHITDEPDTPTMEQCPAVQAYVESASRPVVRLAQGQRPNDETITLRIRCSAASAESVPDARRQRDALVSLVLDALEGSVAARTLQGAVASSRVSRVDLEPVERSTGTFARAVLTVECLTTS